MIDEAKVLDAVAEAAGIDPGVLGDMIARATAFVESQTRWYFGEPTEITEYLSGSGGRFLRLKQRIADEDYVTVTEAPHAGGTATAIDAGAFAIRLDGQASALVRTDGACWIRGYEYAVAYQQGFDAEEIPDDIQQLVIDLIRSRLLNRDTDGLTGETFAGYSYSKTAFSVQDLDKIMGAKETIAAWRRPILA